MIIKFSIQTICIEFPFSLASQFEYTNFECDDGRDFCTSNQAIFSWINLYLKFNGTNLKSYESNVISDQKK